MAGSLAVALDEKVWADAIAYLLPRGQAWRTDANEKLQAFVNVLAQEFSRIDVFLDHIVSEAQPSSTVELLADWERDWGLPDKCIQQPGSVAERQQLLATKVTHVGRQDRAYLIEQAAKLGYTITITEYKQGDTVPGHDEISSDDAQFVIQINVPELTIIKRFSVGSTAGERLRVWREAHRLECELSRYIHAHKRLILTYNDEGGAA